MSDDEGGHTDFLAGDRKQSKREDAVITDAPANGTITGDALIEIDISDALSERDKVKFTIHTKSRHPNFTKKEASVQRDHEEFLWLHDSFKTTPDYAGYIIPPAPPRPNFDSSREKLQKLSEGENVMTKEEFAKMKQELEAEYLATFKKTVAMHELFLQRLSRHKIFQNDHNFQVFLEYDQELNVRGKNKKETFAGFMKGVTKSIDEVALSGQKDPDDFYEEQKRNLVEYHRRVKETARFGDYVACAIKRGSNYLMKVSLGFASLATQEGPEINRFHHQISDLFEKIRKIEARVSSDTDLKLVDLLRYTALETEAGTELMYRRNRALADYETANRNLDKARSKGLGIQEAEAAQTTACEKYESITEMGRSELEDVQRRKVIAFHKYLKEYTELQIKHAKAEVTLLEGAITSLRSM
jgi:sorting nexin-5/6/32